MANWQSDRGSRENRLPSLQSFHCCLSARTSADIMIHTLPPSHVPVRCSPQGKHCTVAARDKKRARRLLRARNAQHEKSTHLRAWTSSIRELTASNS